MTLNNVVWTAFNVVIVIFNTLALLIMIRFAIVNKRVITMASSWASHMGTISGQKGTERKHKRIKAEAKTKLVDAARDSSPPLKWVVDFARNAGITDPDLISLFGDPDVQRAIKAGADTFGGLFNREGDEEGKPRKPKKKRRKDGPPRLPNA